MKTVFLVVTVAVVVVAAILWMRSRIVPTYVVTVRDLPRVLAELSGSRETPAFAVFMFSTPDSLTQDDKLNVQFSVENGRAGLDWVLLARQNIKDQGQFLAFARAAGYVPVAKEMNGVRYLRVEEGDLVRLCEGALTSMYHRPETAPVDMIVEGFDWKPETT